jgi:hypothetical protein
MQTQVLERRFAAIGARAKVTRARGDVGPQIDVGLDGHGEFFDLRFTGNRVSFEVVDADSDDRCLLLLVRDDGEKSKFLCGFDERHWFVAAIPESARGVTGVVTTKDALQPEAVREAVARVRPKGQVPSSERCVRPSGRVVLSPAGADGGRWFAIPSCTRRDRSAIRITTRSCCTAGTGFS